MVTLPLCSILTNILSLWVLYFPFFQDGYLVILGDSSGRKK
ncbi:hypothetical protein FTV88_0424 [Heliorestis convoluta]|uniref:Uncharacterized protein n=1 Tax=Heliorestis convoluta TaxID=356322 RepID=A0A5Q2MYU7_9FIRM|nr:hypothetical protein FTV88_0424 [Heliorestis convoluta]